ncbi:hypothetical protein V1477_016261 [Vespula maculifrons]|uniref:Uncharacterized protein n=1 Tax=Vespula maculifrons TaxID=7453 RepID=A0ABD2BCN0_VESMC
MRTYAEDILPDVPSKGAKSNMHDQQNELSLRHFYITIFHSYFIGIFAQSSKNTIAACEHVYKLVRKNTDASGQKVGGTESAYPACWTSGQTKLWISHGTLNVVADVPRREFSGRFQVIPALAMAHGFRELA